MRYAEFRPAPDLRAFVERYWLLEGAGPGGPILPDGHPELVVHLGAAPVRNGERQASTLQVGQMRAATVLEVDGPVSAWGIRFFPHTARAVTEEVGEGIREWANGAGLRERLGNAGSVGERVGVTDEWLRSRIRGRVPPALVGAAVRLLPRLSVDAVAERLRCSRRHLERAFVAEVGLAPKAWARIVRVQGAIRLREANPEWSWAAVAAESGYADQAHLALDFRSIAGAAPSRLEAALLSHSSKP